MIHQPKNYQAIVGRFQPLGWTPRVGISIPCSAFRVQMARERPQNFLVGNEVVIVPNTYYY